MKNLPLIALFIATAIYFGRAAPSNSGVVYTSQAKTVFKYAALADCRNEECRRSLEARLNHCLDGIADPISGSDLDKVEACVTQRMENTLPK